MKRMFACLTNRQTPQCSPIIAIMPNKTLLKLAPFIFLLLWSGGFTVAKVGIIDAEPMTILALRYCCVLLVLAPFFLFIRPKAPATRTEWMHLLIVGFLIQVVYFGTAYLAFDRGASAGLVALITSLQPILVAIIMPRLSAEKISSKRWIGLLVGLLGALLVIASNSTLTTSGYVAILLCFSALFAITLATVWEKRFGLNHHPLTSNTVQYAVGALFTVPVAYYFETMQINWTWPFIGALTYLVLANSLLAISLLLMMIRNNEASRVSSLFFLVPPMSAVIAYVVLGETMSQLAWLGFAIASVGVLYTTRYT